LWVLRLHVVDTDFWERRGSKGSVTCAASPSSITPGAGAQGALGWARRGTWSSLESSGQRAGAECLAEDATVCPEWFLLAPRGDVRKVCAGVEVLTSVLLVWRPS